jgi:hypothetical protein
MATSQSKARNLLLRFPFTDLAIAVSRTGTRRENYLQAFVEGGTSQSYRWVREAAGSLIYCVELPLFRTPRFDLPQIKEILENITPPHNRAMNVDAAEHLYSLVRPYEYKAFPHESQVLRVGLKQVVSIGLDFYLVDGDRLVFQYPQPRARPVFDDEVATIMMSIIHHAYATGDYAEADIESQTSVQGTNGLGGSHGYVLFHDQIS